MEKGKLTVEKINTYITEIFSESRKFRPNFWTGRGGYKMFLEALPGHHTVNIYDLREGMYDTTGFIGFEYKDTPDSHRVVDVTNDDGTHSYFIDKIQKEWCVASVLITKEEFNKLKDGRK